MGNYTKKVTDPRARWIEEQFQKRPDLSRAELGRLLGRDKSVVTHITKYGRSIKASEWVTIQQFFATTMPELAPLPVEGQIGRAWYDDADASNKKSTRLVAPVLTPPLPGMQTAWEVDRDIPELGLAPGGVIVGVKVEKPLRPIKGQWVVCRRERNGFYQFDVVQWGDEPDPSLKPIALLIETRMPR